MIHHVALEIDPARRTSELEFWGALGWRRDHQKGRSLPWQTEWLKSRFGDPWLHLYPKMEAGVSLTGHLCLVGGLDGRLADLGRAGFSYSPADEWWGAGRVFTASPTGHRVELLEYAPPAARTGPPRED